MTEKQEHVKNKLESKFWSVSSLISSVLRRVCKSGHFLIKVHNNTHLSAVHRNI